MKAIIARLGEMKSDSDHPANPEFMREVARRIDREIVELDDKQDQMRRADTHFLVEIMNHFNRGRHMICEAIMPSGPGYGI
jgi:hypothetical protein